MPEEDNQRPHEQQGFGRPADDSAATDELPSISSDSTDTAAKPIAAASSPQVQPVTKVQVQPAVKPPMHSQQPQAPTLQSSASPAATVDDAPKKRLPLVHLVIELLLVILVAGLGYWGLSLKSDNQNLEKQVATLNASPQIAAQKQADEVIVKVGKLMQLPAGETPTVADVTDASQAKKESAFFTNAQNGDKVLLYAKAGEAILYRPATNKVILVAPLTFNAQTGATNTTTNKPQ